MRDKDVLSENTFMVYAMKHYTNPQCEGIEEFEEDINRIKYIKRLLNKYEEKDILRGRLLLNHIIILNNVFGNEACSRILFHKLEEEFHSAIKTFLEFLNYLPRKLPDIDLSKIPTEHKILTELKKIQ